MTHIYDKPEDFKEQVLDGFARAYGRYVERVPQASGFIRRGGPSEGKVSVVVGGGSGHYPSYSGVLGPGFVDGAVLGDVFASPSAEQVYRVGRAANGGAGVVLAYGNYAGDRLNFAAAQERLQAEGVDCRNVYVTDDIASAAPSEADKRRGIAGTFLVYKVGGAAADQGLDIDGVERVMRKANANTFSYGVAFGGCTMPGKHEPLFTVAPGRMEFGLGIHGEPGVQSDSWMSAADLAERLVTAVLAERPDHADGRAAVIVNGLGATKYEELFVLNSWVDRLLHEAGVRSVLPEVGELVTSLDMAGCSLSIMWLDDELEGLWSAPADTASFRRGEASALPTFEQHRPASADLEHEESVHSASPASRAAAVGVRACLGAMADVVLENEDRLGEIDAVAGDGDHGTGMARGVRAARETAEATEGGIGSVLRAAGDAFADKAGGTSGMLWGLALASIGDTLGDIEPVTPERVLDAVRAGAQAIQRVGKAELGDKTMLDALFPFVDALGEQLDRSVSLAEAWRAAAVVAVEAADRTAHLKARVGRARPLAERSVGTPDPGAVSMGLIVTRVGDVLATADCADRG